jgi:hypothetical protein
VPPPFDLQAFARASMAPEEESLDDRTADMLERFSAGDHEGAIELADLILARSPGSAIAIVCKESCASALEATYARVVGPFARVPVLLPTARGASLTGIDHRAGFLMSLIDGRTTVEAILDVCAMPRWLALRVLGELIREGLVRLR